MKKIILILLSFTLLVSCLKDDFPKDYTKENEQEIQNYLADNNLNATKDDNGVYYIIEEEGTGENPIDTDIVKMMYTGSSTSGDTLISSNDKPTHLIINDIITGLRLGIPYFKKGGSGKIILPSSLAFQEGTVVVFDIELLDIYGDINTANDAEIQDYLVDNEITEYTKTASGLYYIIEEEGTGENPISTDNVTVVYKGYYTDESVFDESKLGIKFNLGRVIEGWTEGIPKFKKGGKGKLLIPSRLGYNDGRVRIFDIELLSIDR